MERSLSDRDLWKRPALCLCSGAAMVSSWNFHFVTLIHRPYLCQINPKTADFERKFLQRQISHMHCKHNNHKRQFKYPKQSILNEVTIALMTYIILSCINLEAASVLVVSFSSDTSMCMHFGIYFAMPSYTYI